jgi:RNA polymerase sigma-70 factor, ECF subfamily
MKTAPPTGAPMKRFFRSRSDARFADLYQRYGPVVYARCRQMLKDAAAAEDITQETFFSIHGTLARFSDDREALAWLYRTATNRCLNELRRGRRRPLSMYDPPDRPGPSFDQRLVDQDLMLRVSADLPETLSIAAWLYHVDGHEQADIAAICGVSRRTIISRLNRFAELARMFIERNDEPVR